MSSYTLKKSLGQHFLKDENICKKIVALLQDRPFTQLLEVGPGGGALTKYLIDLKNVDFKAVEIDQEKIEYLIKTYPALKDKIIHQSFLDMAAPFDGHFTIIGNFPYNISTQILFKALEWKNQITTIIGMFQKDVAQRIAAKPNSKIYGIISILIQAFFDVEYAFDVAPSCFNPPPKVMSGVIRLYTTDQKLSFSSDKAFTLLVKTAFNQRRKKLRNAVKNLFDEKTLQQDIFNKRAEQLSKEDFADLTFLMKEIYQ